VGFVTEATAAANAAAVAHRPARAAKYAALLGVALRQGLTERGALLGRVAFYAVILLVFSRLWQVVLAHGAVAGAGPVELLWYLALTEWVMLALPPLHLRIEADVRSGDIACHLPRPVSYLGARLAEAAGDWLLRALTLGIAGVALAWALSGAWPADSRGLLLALPLGLLAGLVGLVFHALIGLSAVWLQDVSPVFWVWQKLAFALGGLILPLEIYPAWLRTVAGWTPFSALMHGTGRMAFGLDPAFAAEVAGRLVIWGALSALLLGCFYRRGLRVLDVNGG
jgi:ABC-2 type transport system permease protein